MSRMEPYEHNDEQISPEVRDRAVRLVLDHQDDHPSRWAAQTLGEWVRKAGIDGGLRSGIPSEISEKMKALERERPIDA